MHSFILLAIASSAFALPTLVNSPVTAVVPIKNVAGVVSKIAAPIHANVADYSKIGSDVLSHNTIGKRGTTITNILATAQAEVNSVVTEVKDLLASTSGTTVAAIDDILYHLKDLLVTVETDISSLKYSNADYLVGYDGVDVKVEDIGRTLVDVLETVADLLKEIDDTLHYDLSSLYGELGGTIEAILEVVIDLLPAIRDVLRGLLTSVCDVLRAVNILLDLRRLGL